MNCIYCNNPTTKIIETASSKTTVIRKRRCDSCKQSYFTEEIIGNNQTALRSMLTHLREESRDRYRSQKK